MKTAVSAQSVFTQAGTPQNKGAVVCFQQPWCCTGALTLAGLDLNLQEKRLFVWKWHITPHVLDNKAAVSHNGVTPGVIDSLKLVNSS